MPLFSIAKFWSSLLSLLVLAGAAYLLWSFVQGAWTSDAFGRPVFYREPWRLWTGLAGLLVSFLGRPLVLLLIGRPSKPQPRPRLASETVSGASGSSLHVETAGPTNAPVIIFTHGWGMAASFWHDHAAHLANRFRVVLWDLPGLGQSSLCVDKRVDLRDYAADLASLVGRFGGDRPVLVGHSIGGMVIQTLLRDRPEIADQLGGVVLLNTTFTNPLKTMILAGLAQALQPVLEVMMRLTIWLEPLVWVNNWQSYLSGGAHLAMRLGFGERPSRRDLDEVVLLGTKNRPGVQASGNLAMFSWDAEGALAQLRLPVLVVCGDRDIVTKAESGRRIAAEAPSGRVEVVAGANHMGPKERESVYDALIADFVLAVQPAAGDDRAIAPVAPAPPSRAARGDGAGPVDEPRPRP